MRRALTVRTTAVIAVLATLALAGCGRKAGLDAPPGAAVEPSATTPQRTSDDPVTPNSQRRSPLDWLID